MVAYNTAPTSSYSDARRGTHRLWRRGTVFALILVLALCGAALAQKKAKTKTPPPPAPKESEYSARFRGAEAALAGIDRAYLVLDLAKNRLRLKLRGVIVREFKFTPLGDADEAKAFAGLAAASDTVTKAMVRMHVFDAERQLNDTVLGIVAQATTAPADLLQRYRPGRIAVTFSDRLALDVSAADIVGQPFSWKDNLAEDMRLFADDFFGGECLSIQIGRDDAMSFYGVCRGAPPLLVAP
jgi:hypothetical protein